MVAMMSNGSRLPMIHYDFRATGLVVFDMLEAYRDQIEAAGSIGPAQQLIEACREVGVPIFFARADHRPDGADFAHTIADTDSQLRPWGPGNPYRTVPPHASGSPEMAVLSEIAPQPGDYDVPKHRWSAFHGTHLELSLRSRYIDTIVLIGGSVHVGIASTAYEGRDKRPRSSAPASWHGRKDSATSPSSMPTRRSTAFRRSASPWRSAGSARCSSTTPSPRSPTSGGRCARPGAW
jgi:nicotinamidase-related amidase